MSTVLRETIEFKNYLPIVSGEHIKPHANQKSKYRSNAFPLWSNDSFNFSIEVHELKEADLTIKMRASRANYEIKINGKAVITNQLEKGGWSNSPFNNRSWDITKYLREGENDVTIHCKGGDGSPLNLKEIVVDINMPDMLHSGQPPIPDVDLGKGKGANEILKRVSKEMLGKIKAQGMPLHGGDNPPNVEGTYHLNNFILKSSLVPGDHLGRQFSDLTLTLSDQKDHNITVSYINGPERGDGIGSFIVGEDDNFTIGLELNITIGNAPSAKIILLISGSLDSKGVKNAHWANFMIDNPNNSSTYIQNETGRVIYDRDGFSNKVSK